MKQHKVMKRLLALCLCVLLCASVGVIGEAKAAKAISKASVTLSKTSFVYSGKAKIPDVTVRFGNKTLKQNVHYTLHYRNNTEPGIATVIVKAKKDGGYTGKVTVQYDIVPKQVSEPTLLKADATCVKLGWTAVHGATGYVVYRYDPLTGKAVKVKATKKTAKTINDLQSDKTYLFVVRAYTKTEQKNLYGKYSPWLNVKTKRSPLQPETSKTAPYRTLIQSGTYRVTLTTDREDFAGTPVTVSVKGGNCAIEARIGLTQYKLLKNRDGACLLQPGRSRYMPISDAQFREAADKTDLDDLLEALEIAAGQTPQIYEVRSGKKLLTREQYLDGDDWIAFDFDGNTLVRVVFTDANGEVSVITVSAFTGDVANSVFELPQDYTEGQISLPRNWSLL